MKLHVENLSKRYGDTVVLKDISYTFESGKIYGLLGRNGAGKTTFFNCLNQDILCNGGSAFLESESGRDLLNPKDIGYVLSTPVVPEFLTGREFLKFFLDIHKDKNHKSLDEYFDLVQLSQADQNKLLRDYSHGMKSKMQLLIHIISNPKVILLDEPLTSLDIVVQDEMKKLLKELKNDHIIIFSTHILEIALDLCDEIIVLNNCSLETVEKKNLNTKKYKEKIIKMLKEEKSND